MSGFEIVLYVAGSLLLLQLFLEQLTKLVERWRKLMCVAKEPLPPARQPPALPDTRSTNALRLPDRSNGE